LRSLTTRGNFVLLAVAFALGSSAGTAQIVLTNTELPNFHPVNGNLYRGGQPGQTGIDLLAGLGVKSIVNLRTADESTRAEQWWAEEAGLCFFNVPMNGSGRPTDAQVQAVLSFINAPENQPVF